MNFNKMVDSIKRAYPEERLESSKKRLINVWNLKIPKDRIPFVFSKIPDDSGVNESKLLENASGHLPGDWLKCGLPVSLGDL